MRSRIVSAVLWLLVISTMVAIFLFSAENAEDSRKTSGTVIRAAAEILVPGFDSMTEAEQKALIDSVTKTVRKLAHFTIYAWLGFWLQLLLRSYRKHPLIALAVILAAMYAVTDELHQLLVSGRSGEIRDVLIDSSGALVGAVISFVICLVWQKLRNNGAKRV